MEAYGYIYITTNKINGKRYIGQHRSKDWDSTYIGSGILLKKAIQKYGKENFTCFPLVWAWNKEELNQLEISYIKHYQPEYNIAPGGYINLSQESINKISNSLKGNIPWNKGKTNIYSEEALQKMKNASKFTGKKHSEETRKKISEGNKGKILSEKTRKKMSEKHKGKQSPNKGKILSDETRQKISERNKGNKNCLGRILSENTKQKISNSLTGKSLSEEHKRKLSETTSNYWKTKKELTA
jgi:group I intron endonuclease